jgi:hypothetical protein
VTAALLGKRQEKSKSHDKQEQSQTMVSIEGTNRQKELLY